jgi:hypothetical protein
MTHRVATVVLVSLVFTLLAPAARAAVNVERSGAENPVQEIAKSTLWGGVAGLTLGLALAVATSSDDSDGDIIRWGFAGGTFFGFGFGVYHVMSRPSPTAMLEFEVEHDLETGTSALHVPTPAPAAHGGVELRLVSVRF